MDTVGAIESVRFNGVSILSGLNLKKMLGWQAFFSQGQSKLSKITMCPYEVAVHKARFKCIIIVTLNIP